MAKNSQQGLILRIVAGKHRGRPLIAPPGPDIRPTSDRAREGLFNILEYGRSRIGLNETRVLDAFAGTGALGLEALSRGVRHSTFIENARTAQLTIAKNIAGCGEVNRTTIINADATNPPPTDRPVDIAFVDPPYAARLIEPALIALNRRGWFHNETRVVAEMGTNETLTLPKFLEEVDRRKYGAALILFLLCRGRAD